MIHLNSMFSPENNVAPPSHNTKDALRGFHEVLSDAVSSKPEKLGIHPKDGNISIARAGAATPPEAPTNTALPETSSSTSGAPDDGYNPFLQAAYSNPFQSAPTASTSQSTANPNSSPSDAQQAFDDAYWAAQPAPVQALRTMQDPEQRTGLATQLANEGYTIDGVGLGSIHNHGHAPGRRLHLGAVRAPKSGSGCSGPAFYGNCIGLQSE